MTADMGGAGRVHDRRLDTTPGDVMTDPIVPSGTDDNHPDRAQQVLDGAR